MSRLGIVTPEQGVLLSQLMMKGMRRPDFRFNPGFSFHTSWDRMFGRPRLASRKAECVEAVVKDLQGESICPAEPQAQWLDKMLPNWRRDIGLSTP